MTYLRLLFSTILLQCTFSLFSQDTLANAVPNLPLSPLIKDLPFEVKVKILDYMRYLVDDFDSEIQYTFDRLDDEKKEKVIQYIYAESSLGAVPMRTNVSWDRDTIFMGEIEEGKVIHEAFTVRNDGVHPYLIFTTSTICDCTLLSHSIYPLETGNQTHIYVTFNSTGKLGGFTLPLFVTDNSRPNSRHILYIQGTVVKKRGY